MSNDSTESNDRVAEFTAFRKRMNERILAEPNQVVRRFFALDTQTYQAGALREDQGAAGPGRIARAAL